MKNFEDGLIENVENPDNSLFKFGKSSRIIVPSGNRDLDYFTFRFGTSQRKVISVHEKPQTPKRIVISDSSVSNSESRELKMNSRRTTNRDQRIVHVKPLIDFSSIAGNFMENPNVPNAHQHNPRENLLRQDHDEIETFARPLQPFGLTSDPSGSGEYWEGGDVSSKDHTSSGEYWEGGGEETESTEENVPNPPQSRNFEFKSPETNSTRKRFHRDKQKMRQGGQRESRFSPISLPSNKPDLSPCSPQFPKIGTRGSSSISIPDQRPSSSQIPSNMAVQKTNVGIIQPLLANPVTGETEMEDVPQTKFPRYNRALEPAEVKLQGKPKLNKENKGISDGENEEWVGPEADKDIQQGETSIATDQRSKDYILVAQPHKDSDNRFALGSRFFSQQEVHIGPEKQDPHLQTKDFEGVSKRSLKNPPGSCFQKELSRTGIPGFQSDANSEKHPVGPDSQNESSSHDCEKEDSEETYKNPYEQTDTCTDNYGFDYPIQSSVSSGISQQLNIPTQEKPVFQGIRPLLSENVSERFKTTHPSNMSGQDRYNKEYHASSPEFKSKYNQPERQQKMKGRQEAFGFERWQNKKSQSNLTEKSKSQDYFEDKFYQPENPTANDFSYGYSDKSPNKRARLSGSGNPSFSQEGARFNQGNPDSRPYIKDYHHQKSGYNESNWKEGDSHGSGFSKRMSDYDAPFGHGAGDHFVDMEQKYKGPGSSTKDHHPNTCEWDSGPIELEDSRTHDFQPAERHLPGLGDLATQLEEEPPIKICGVTVKPVLAKLIREKNLHIDSGHQDVFKGIYNGRDLFIECFQSPSGHLTGLLLGLLQVFEPVNDNITTLIFHGSRKSSDFTSEMFEDFIKNMPEVKWSKIRGGIPFDQSKLNSNIIIGTMGIMLQKLMKANLSNLQQVIFIDAMQFFEKPDNGLMQFLHSLSPLVQFIVISQNVGAFPVPFFMRSVIHVMLEKHYKVQHHYITLKEANKTKALVQLLSMHKQKKIGIYVQTPQRSVALGNMLKSLGINVYSLNDSYVDDSRQECHKNKTPLVEHLKAECRKADVLVVSRVKHLGRCTQGVGVFILYDMMMANQAQMYHNIDQHMIAEKGGQVDIISFIDTSSLSDLMAMKFLQDLEAKPMTLVYQPNVEKSSN